MTEGDPRASAGWRTMRTTLKNGSRVVWWGLCLAALMSTGCELITAPDRTLIPGSGGTAGAGGVGGTGGTGGTTTSGECAVAEDCPDPGNECLVRTCVEKACASVPVAEGTEVAGQADGDCQSVVCDGAGATRSDDDDADIPKDGKQCTADTCAGGVPSNTPVAAGTACGAGGALYCDDGGECVGCLTDAQCGTASECSSPVCDLGTCKTNFTAPGTPVATQTEGDCLEVQCDGVGGTKSVEQNTDITDDGNACTQDVCLGGAATHPNSPSGAACADGGIKCDGAGTCVACLSGLDCGSGVCTAHVCAAPECSDGVKNGPETDVDCGGSCPPCGTGAVCAVTDDCTSKVCTGSVCQAASCSDTVKNGSESDVDCGGSCLKCGPGLACGGNADCKGGNCTGNTCVPTCTDTVKNGAETDVDCGGSCAAKCANSKNCGANTDCASAHCLGSNPGVCVQCIAALDCPATGNECIDRTCDANACGTTNLDQTHTLSTGQASGNCQKIVCNGAGGTVSVDDPADLPASNTVCLTVPACSGAPLTPSFTPAAQGASCVADNQAPKKVCGGGAKAGVCVECNSIADCPATGNECIAATCNNNVCGTTNLDQSHTLSTGQTSGNCQKIVCNGAGGTISIDDAADLPVSNTACLMSPACTGAPLTPSFTPAAQGDSCTTDNQPPKRVCGGGGLAGVCVECNGDADCTAPTPTCSSNVCVP